MADRLPPCTSCGACCVPSEDYGYHADLEPEDEVRMGRRRLLRATVVVGRGPHRATKTRSFEDLTICSSLRGAPMKRCSCAVYEHRPTVCRAFERGSIGCLESRAQLGAVDQVAVARGR